MGDGPNRVRERDRRAKANEAVRLAEARARTLGKASGVIYRPSLLTPKAASATKQAPANRALEFALKKALPAELLESSSKAGEQSRRAAPIDPAKAAAARDPKVSFVRKDAAASKPAKSGPINPKSPQEKARQKLLQKQQQLAAAQKRQRERAKKSLETWRKQALKTPLRPQFVRRTIEPAVTAAGQTETADHSPETGSKQIASKPRREQSFSCLRDEWLRAIRAAHIFDLEDPAHPYVAKAQANLAEIEAEWQRRVSLAKGMPGYFEWPTTAAKQGDGELTADWESTGILGYLGYKVGVTSDLSTRRRQLLLQHVFSMHLPPINSEAYMKEWGKPGTPARLQKMAESLAAFARNAKRRRSQNLAQAIRDWEEDLSHLRQSYYVEKFRFAFVWPEL